MIGGRRPLRGRKVGDRRVRVERPNSACFCYTGPGQLTARPAANAPKTTIGRTWSRVKAVAIEAPMTIVVVSEYLGNQWWDRVLYNQTAHRLRSVLAGREHTVVVDVPYRHRAEPLVAGVMSDAGPGNDSGVASSA